MFFGLTNRFQTFLTFDRVNQLGVLATLAYDIHADEPVERENMVIDEIKLSIVSLLTCPTASALLRM